MPRNNKNNKPEIETAFAIAILLQNILILAVLCGLVWFLHTTITQSSSLNALMHNGIFQ